MQERALQLSFIGELDRIPAKEVDDEIRSIDVLFDILRNNQNIESLTYTVYNPHESSSESFSDTNILYRLHQNYVSPQGLRALEYYVKAHSMHEVRLSQDFSGERSNTLAIASKVTLKNGRSAHIPLLDFSVSHSEEALEEITNEVYPYNGVILQTDNSYHFMGYDLLSENDWKYQMNDFIGKESERRKKGKHLQDKYFLEKSIERGFAALRIFSHIESGRREDPKVMRQTYS